MEKKLLKVKGRFEGKKFKVTHVRISKEVAEHPLNKDFGLKVGYVPVADCIPECPDDTKSGYYQCVGGNCVYVPFS